MFIYLFIFFFFFFQAEDGIRDLIVTGVQTCALPIWIPRKIDRGEGFINFTADQWRTFFTIYATTSLWEYLSAIDRTILTHFVRVCSVLVGRILTFDLIEEAAERLIKIIKLIEEHYGRDKITP